MKISPLEHHKQRGFTLIELMIVIGIVGVLVTIAFPSYTAYIKKSRRTEAQTAIMNIAAEMEKLYGRQGSYQNAVCIAGNASGNQIRIAGNQSSDSDGAAGDYVISCPVAANFASFQVFAVPVADGPQDTDDRCQQFRYDSSLLNRPLGSPGGNRSATDSAGNDSTAECW